MDDHQPTPPAATATGGTTAVAPASGGIPPAGPIIGGRPPTGAPPKFVTGSLLRHILVMTGTSAVGLMALFVGELANLIFLAQLGDEAILAAVGYGSAIVFFTVSIGIGLAIAASALVAPALGARDRERARQLSTSCLITTVVVAGVASVFVLAAAPGLLTLLGATGRTHALAVGYLTIVIPSLIPLAIGMTATGILRSVGDARRAMNVTLVGAIVNLALDIPLIFWLGLGLDGAAWAIVLSRLAVAGVGLYGVITVHDLAAPVRWQAVRADLTPIAAIAVPAILTNIATPVSNAMVTAAIAVHGDAAVAGWTAIGRIVPVAFGAIFALTGAVGPILGQNYGAGDMVRMRRAFTLCLWVTAAFTAIAWVLLALSTDLISASLKVSDEAAGLIGLFCRWLSPLFVFLGALFVANAAFNTLGRASMSTALNWGRATLGTVPFVLAGGAIGGAAGVLIGQNVGAIAFGVLGVWLCYRHMDRLAASSSGRS